MKKYSTWLLFAFTLLTFINCAGIRHFGIETHEPAQVTLPTPIRTLLVVNNVVQQPDDIGHEEKLLGTRHYERSKASSDSVAVYYTEALTQFLDEEEFFDAVIYHNDPIREDKDFWQEFLILPEKMFELREESSTDAIVSLDKMIIQTRWTDYYQTEGYKYASLTAKIESTIRVYMPSLDGKIPAVQFTDSLVWEGYNIRDDRAYAERIVPTPEEAMKQIAVYAAEKMTRVFAPYWEYQERWYYTPMSSRMREGAVYARNNEWENALEKWSDHYNKERTKLGKAKAAHNIALSYELLDNMDSAKEWAETAYELFEQSTSGNSMERRRSLLYKNEIQRRIDFAEKLKKQLEEDEWP